MIDRIPKTKITGEVVRRIQQSILAGEFAPGDRLPPIRELADRLGVGLTSVREALRQLETLGLVRIQHGAGVYVTGSADQPLFIRMLPTGTGMADKTRFDLISVRKMLETGGAELSAKRASQQQIEHLKEILDRMEEHIGDVERFSQTDTEFHVYIAEMSGNEILPLLLSSIRELIVRHQVELNAPIDFRKRSLRYHASIYDAIRGRSPIEARTLMAAHLDDVLMAAGYRPEDGPEG